MQPTQGKRQYRNDMSDEQKQKISRKLQGRKLSQDTKNKISKSMCDYWGSLSYKPVTSTGTTNNNTSTNTTQYGE